MIKEINSTKAYSILQQSKNAILIDVRSSIEYDYVGHPINAIHIPVKEAPDWEIRDDFIENVRSELKKKFPDIEYLNAKGEVVTISLYCSALYLQLDRLDGEYDMSTAKTKAGGIAGISKRGFTKKDFMARYTTGSKKLIWGNPFIKKEKIKGQGEVTSMMTKANGQLEIIIDVDRTKGHEIKTMIENAGVSSFYLGK